jgi:hypothetical protein
MDPLTTQKLDELLELTRQNHKILKRMRRGQLIGTIIRWLYIVLILASFYGVYKFVFPSLKSLYGSYSSVLENTKGNDTFTLPGGLNADKLNSLLEKYNLK